MDSPHENPSSSSSQPHHRHQSPPPFTTGSSRGGRGAVADQSNNPFSSASSLHHPPSPPHQQRHHQQQHPFHLPLAQQQHRVASSDRMEAHSPRPTGFGNEMGGGTPTYHHHNMVSSPLSARRIIPSTLPGASLPPMAVSSQLSYPTTYQAASQAETVSMPPGATTAGRMLVDPLTGQQFFLPATAATQPLVQSTAAYYPVAYAAQQMVTTSSGLLIHPGHQSLAYAFLPTAQVPPTQPTPQSPTHHAAPQQAFFHHQYQPLQSHHQIHAYGAHMQAALLSEHPQQGNNGVTGVVNEEISAGANDNGSVRIGDYAEDHHPGYRVEIPPSSAASMCCDEVGVGIWSHPDEYHYPISSPRLYHDPHRIILPKAAFGQPQRHAQQHKQQQGGAVMAAVDASASSSSTSGIGMSAMESPFGSRQGQTMEQLGYSDRRGHETCTSAGNAGVGDAGGRQQRGGECKSPPPISSSPPSHPLPKPLPQLPSPVVVPKAVRMDIDLTRPLTPPSPKAPKKTVAAPSTAFTISFGKDGNTGRGCGSDKYVDGPNEAEKWGGQLLGSARTQPTTLSLQDAARLAPTGRRMLKRAEEALKQQKLEGQQQPAHPTNSCSSSSNDRATNPKQYLFEKMLEGHAAVAAASGRHLSHHGDGNDERGELSDVQSEAGTFIIECSSVAMTSSQRTMEADISEDARSSSSSSASTPTATTPSSSIHAASKDKERASDRKGKPLPARRSTTPRRSLPARGGPPQQQRGEGADSSKRSLLMSDLRRLCEQKVSPRPHHLQTLRGMAGSSNGQRPQRSCQQQKRPATTGNFSRVDGGRFSMRSVGGAHQSQPHPFSSASRLAAERPPFRTGVGSGYAKPNKMQFPATQQANETPEMAAWLRRKEYDPRKSAAEAKQLQQLKQRLIKLTGNQRGGKSSGKEEAFLTNRSLSYHNAGGSGSQFKEWRNRRHDDDYSNHSFDELSRLGEEESEGDEELPSNEQQQHTGHASGSNNVALKRTVDDLTEKCKRSIELLRLCNRDRLSESVEDLLNSVVMVEESGGEEKEAITNRKPLPTSASGESLAQRLDRLNSAFDAIQKYLEEQSAGGDTSASISPPLTGHSRVKLSEPATVPK